MGRQISDKVMHQINQKMPAMPWAVAAESAAETCLSLAACHSVWIFEKLHFKFNISSSHYSNILSTVRMQTHSSGQIASSSRILSVSLRSPNNGCSNLFQDTNTRQQLGVWWSALMSGNAISRTGIRRWFSAMTNLLLVTLSIVARCEQMDPWNIECATVQKRQLCILPSM